MRVAKILFPRELKAIGGLQAPAPFCAASCNGSGFKLLSVEITSPPFIVAMTINFTRLHVAIEN